MQMEKKNMDQYINQGYSNPYGQDPYQNQGSSQNIPNNNQPNPFGNNNQGFSNNSYQPPKQW